MFHSDVTCLLPGGMQLVIVACPEMLHSFVGPHTKPPSSLAANLAVFTCKTQARLVPPSPSVGYFYGLVSVKTTKRIAQSAPVLTELFGVSSGLREFSTALPSDAEDLARNAIPI